MIVHFLVRTLYTMKVVHHIKESLIFFSEDIKYREKYYLHQTPIEGNQRKSPTVQHNLLLSDDL